MSVSEASLRKPRVIDNKKVLLTDAEFKIYQDIIASYTTETYQGEILFKGKFVTDKNGYIISLLPFNSYPTTMEVYLFLANIMQHQHLDAGLNEIKNIWEELRKELVEIRKLKEELKKK